MIRPTTWYAVKRLKWLRRAALLSPFNRIRVAAWRAERGMFGYRNVSRQVRKLRYLRNVAGYYPNFWRHYP